MFDLLTLDEDKQAAASGWTLQYVYDDKTSRWTVQVFPIAMTVNVIHQARIGNQLALKALRFVAAPVTRKKTK